MNKILLLCAIFISTSKIFGQQIQNGGFENWTTTQSAEPNNWASNNFMAGMGGSPFVTQSTTAHSGSYAVQMVTASAFNPMSQHTDTVPGFIFTGMAPTGPGTFPVNGIALSQHADSLIAWYKYAPAGADSFMIMVATTKWNGTGRDTTSKTMFKGGASANFVKLSLPLHYTMMTPSDSIYIEIASSNHRGGKIGSTLIVDDVSLVFGTTSINEKYMEKSTFALAPNPASTNISIIGAVVGAVEIIDAFGQMVQYINTKNNSNINIDISNFCNGIYTLKSDNGMIRKFIVAH